jgi:hypothetical protein
MKDTLVTLDELLIPDDLKIAVFIRPQNDGGRHMLMEETPPK